MRTDLERLEDVRASLQLALSRAKVCDPSRETALAITKIEEAILWLRYRSENIQRI